MQRVFQDFVEGIRASEDADTLRSVTAKALAAFDLHAFAYVVFSNSSAGATDLISTYPRTWLDHHIRNKYEKIDPVIRGVRTAVTPFGWHRDAALSRSSPLERRLFDEAAAFGIRCGFAIPFRDGGAAVAAMTLVADEPYAAFQRRIAVNRRTLLLMAVFVHAYARRIIAADPIVDGVRLTPRELDCLRWAAHGKSAWEIGCILGISRRTVSFHIENAKAKLGVRTICQAVARLSAGGL